MMPTLYGVANNSLSPWQFRCTPTGAFHRGHLGPGFHSRTKITIHYQADVGQCAVAIRPVDRLGIDCKADAAGREAGPREITGRPGG